MKHRKVLDVGGKNVKLKTDKGIYINISNISAYVI